MTFQIIHGFDMKISFENDPGNHYQAFYGIKPVTFVLGFHAR
jgi:hypothetical protein